MPLDFSLGQNGSRFLHFTNRTSVSSLTFGDRSGFWLLRVLLCFAFSSFMDLGKRSYMTALRSTDVAKLMEDLPEMHGGLCVAEYKMLYRRDRVNTSLLQA